MDISVVILNYKSKGLTLNCVKSIKEADFGNLKREIIVVDNNSGDSIGEILNWQYPEVKFIQNKRNLGMGAGNNVGIRRASGEYIVIMNPDTLAFRDTFRKMYEFMEANKSVGVAGPRQFNPDKTIQHSCFRWHSLFTPLYRRTPLGKFKFAKKDLDRFLMKDAKSGEAMNNFTNSSRFSALRDAAGLRNERGRALEVDWLLGSFLFCRAGALQDVGLFDERFFLYFEDTDLCRRFWEKNWRVVYFPEAKVIHNHARKSAEEPWYRFFASLSARSHIASWVRYLKKWRKIKF